MTEERKREIILLLENDDTEDIGREEAEDFFDSLTEEENKYVRSLCSKNIRKRNAKREEEIQKKLWEAHDNRVLEMARIRRLFIDNVPHEEVYNACKRFADEFLVAKKPKLINIEGLGSHFECDVCGNGVVKGQPFCVNCGLPQDWSDYFDDMWMM